MNIDSCIDKLSRHSPACPVLVALVTLAGGRSLPSPSLNHCCGCLAIRLPLLVVATVCIAISQSTAMMCIFCERLLCCAVVSRRLEACWGVFGCLLAYLIGITASSSTHKQTRS